MQLDIKVGVWARLKVVQTTANQGFWSLKVCVLGSFTGAQLASRWVFGELQLEVFNELQPPYHVPTPVKMHYMGDRYSLAA